MIMMNHPSLAKINWILVHTRVNNVIKGQLKNVKGNNGAPLGVWGTFHFCLGRFCQITKAESVKKGQAPSSGIAKIRGLG